MENKHNTDAKADLPKELRPMLLELRSKLENDIEEFPIDCCDQASSAVELALRQRGYQVRQAWGTYEPVGFRRHPHDWSVIRCDGADWVVDLSADQWDGEPVTLVPLTDATRYHENDMTPG